MPNLAMFSAHALSSLSLVGRVRFVPNSAPPCQNLSEFKKINTQDKLVKTKMTAKIIR
jgi:hypothetical protein